jgi:hypothetical protein
VDVRNITSFKVGPVQSIPYQKGSRDSQYIAGAPKPPREYYRGWLV